MGTPWYLKATDVPFFLKRDNVHRNTPEPIARAIDKPKHWHKKRGKKHKRGFAAEELIFAVIMCAAIIFCFFSLGVLMVRCVK